MYKTSHKFCINYPKWAPNAWFSIILFTFFRYLPRVSGKLIWEQKKWHHVLLVTKALHVAASNTATKTRNDLYGTRVDTVTPFPFLSKLNSSGSIEVKKPFSNSDKNPNILILSIGNISILACNKYSAHKVTNHNSKTPCEA